MKREDWTVGKYAVRPARPDGTCFYCKVLLGGQHEYECPIRRRTVVLDVKVRVAITVPEHWEEELVNFHFNESGWCASNIIDHMREQTERSGCLCHNTHIELYREATHEDEEEFGLFIKEEES